MGKGSRPHHATVLNIKKHVNAAAWDYLYCSRNKYRKERYGRKER